MHSNIKYRQIAIIFLYKMIQILMVIINGFIFHYVIWKLMLAINLSLLI